MIGSKFQKNKQLVFRFPGNKKLNKLMIGKKLQYSIKISFIKMRKKMIWFTK